jgi:molybdopterin molybdotransferase
MTQSCDAAGDILMPVGEAIAELLSGARPVAASEELAVSESLGRVVASPMVSPIDVPGYDNSAMDGYALRAMDTAPGGTTRLVVSQRIAAGDNGAPLEPGTAARIFTGAAIPPGADTVVMQEAVERAGDAVVISGAVAPGENIRPRGNDIAAGTEILATGVRIGPQHMGLLASVGIPAVPVLRRIRVGLFFTGDELVMPGAPLPPGHIYNSNQFTLVGLLQRLGCEIVNLGLVPDDLPATRRALRHAAAQTDVVITSGGVSVGEEDHVRTAVATEGSIKLWKIAIKPGKPFAFGQVADTDFLGLPGNPVSVFVTFVMLVRPFLLRRMGVHAVLPVAHRVRAGFEWSRPRPRREFVRARLQPAEDGALQAIPFARQGSDVLTSVVWADGLVEIPEHRTLHRGEPVAFYPLTELLT